MTGRLLTANILLLLSAFAALADPLVVRSGEHRGFTRVVLPLPEGATWELYSAPGVTTLAFEGFTDGFDLSDAFDIIPRTRLSALLAQPSTLELQLACDCPVTAFEERNRYIVLDIGDGPPLTEEAMIEPVAVVATTLPESSFGFGELLWRRGEDQAEVEAEEDMAMASAEFDGIDEDEQAETEFILETQQELVESFARAASRGLLEPKAPLESAPSVEAATEAEIFDSSMLQPDVEIDPQRNIRITDSRDRPIEAEGEELTLKGASCPDPETVSVGGWGTDESFHVQIARSNEMLVDEFGRLDPGAVVDRARLYLFFGFGMEALQTLGMIPGLDIANPELVDIARILEFGHASNPRSLHRYADCASDLALWGILSTPDLPMDIPIDAEAALRALQKLPAHLKFHLAQELGTRLLDRGDIENASIAMRTYERLEQNTSDTPKMVEATDSNLRGDTAKGEQILEEILEENTTEAPEAITALVDTLVDQGKAVPPDIALLAESFAFEQRNSSRRNEAYRTLVLAAAASSQFTKAFDALGETSGEVPEASERALATKVFSLLAENASDSEFVQQFYQQYPSRREIVDAEAKTALASRLYDLGFADDARSLLEGLPAQEASDDLRLLKARLLLRDGRYEDSLAEVAGLPGKEAARTRAAALEKLGSNAAAAAAFEEASMSDHARSTLLLSEEWEQLVDADTPVLGALSELARSEERRIPTDDRMLANSQEAIAESVSARSVLNAALETLEFSEE